MQNDISGLVSQLKDMQQRNVELEKANRNLTSTVCSSMIDWFCSILGLTWSKYCCLGHGCMFDELASHLFSFKQEKLRTTCSRSDSMIWYC